MGLKDRAKIKLKQKKKRQKKRRKLSKEGKDPSEYYYNGIWIGVKEAE
jgi:hypothetical protein